MKRIISSVLFGILFLCGLVIFSYPYIANEWNAYRQARLVSSYEEELEKMSQEDFTKEWELARSFNQEIETNQLYHDVFGSEEHALEDTVYWNILNIKQDGIMGYISIPKINVKLSIYHGTEEEILQTGVGHLNGTKLPIGGESTHSVLAAHRGLPSAKLFTDVDQLERGDMFYIHILDEVLAYEVDRISDMIDKDDMEQLQEELKIQEMGDYVTLFTCTPYGVNSHRLLVRGKRVPYTGEEEEVRTSIETMVKAIQEDTMLYTIIGLSITALIILILNQRKKRKKHRDKK